MHHVSTRPSLVYSFIAVDGDGISDQLMEDCARLVSQNYGIGRTPISVSECLLAGSERNASLLLRALSWLFVSMVTNFSATPLPLSGSTVGWVTQLVVDSTVRRRYIATQLLQTLKIHERFRDVTVVDVPVDHVDFEFLKQYALKILASSPVDYLKNVKPYGSLFEENCPTEILSSLYTQFLVDHSEHLDALKTFKASNRWTFGDPPEGMNF